MQIFFILFLFSKNVDGNPLNGFYNSPTEHDTQFGKHWCSQVVSTGKCVVRESIEW